MIRYRRLNEDESSDFDNLKRDKGQESGIYRKILDKIKKIVPYNVVGYAGHDWYVIDLRGDVVTLLAKNYFPAKSSSHYCTNNNKTHTFNFDTIGLSYKRSNMREDLNSIYLPELIKNGADPLPTNLPDVGVTGDKLWLLSEKEAEKLPIEVRKIDGIYGWWLRTLAPNSSGRYKGSTDYSDRMLSVEPNGSIKKDGWQVKYFSCLVRPAMKVKLDDLIEYITMSL